MGRAPTAPPELLAGPFTLDDARHAGVTRSALRGKNWVRLSNGLYSARERSADPVDELRGWLRTLPEGTTFAGATAAWLHWLKVDPLDPIEVIVRAETGVRSRPALVARRSRLDADDVELVRGLPATTLLRTLADLCCWRSPIEALIVLDMAVAAGLTRGEKMAGYANSIRGRAGSRRLRELAGFAEPAESPMETKLRWLFHEAGLPRPQVQVDLRDATGILIARADLYYPSARLVIEFDGMNHKERLVADDRRQNLIVNAGYQLLRFTTADLRDRPDLIVLQVQAALASPAFRAF